MLRSLRLGPFGAVEAAGSSRGLHLDSLTYC
jgi:hypothetical protein